MPEKQTNETAASQSQLRRRRMAAPDAPRAPPPSDCQEITMWSRRYGLTVAMESPCGGSDEGISIPWHTAPHALETETPWSHRDMRSSSPGSTLEIEEPSATPPQHVQLHRHHGESASTRGTPPATAHRACFGDALSPDTVFEVDLLFRLEIEAGGA